MTCARCGDPIVGIHRVLWDESLICEECVTDAAYANPTADLDPNWVARMRHDLFHVLNEDAGCWYCTHGVAA